MKWKGRKDDWLDEVWRRFNLNGDLAEPAGISAALITGCSKWGQENRPLLSFRISFWMQASQRGHGVFFNQDNWEEC